MFYNLYGSIGTITVEVLEKSDDSICNCQLLDRVVTKNRIEIPGLSLTV